MIKIIFLLFCSLFISLSSFAESANDNIKTPSFDEYSKNLEILSFSENADELQAAKEKLFFYPTIEVYETAVHRIESFLDSGDRDLDHNKEGVLDTNLFIFVGIVAELGSVEDIKLINEVMMWVEIQESDDNKEMLAGLLDHVVGVLKERTSRPSLSSFKNFSGSPHVLSITASKEDSHKSVLKDVDRFLENFKSVVKGQDEVLESFQTLYLKDKMNGGNRSRPEVFYFMGLPGNGKDTIAEGYVDTLYGQVGAHKDHMFRMNIRNKSEAWSYFGSAKGYIGSEEVPEFLRFLVEHSGGKYILRSPGVDKKENPLPEVVELNPNYSLDKLSLTSKPHKAVVFVNEAHNIPKEVKDNLLKQAIERGIFPITNPGGTPNSVSEIELPVTFIFATNEGIDLLEPRQKNGVRYGEPLSYDEIIQNFQRVKDDKEELKNAILRNNGEINSPNSDQAEGTSEEFLNRIPAHRVHLLKPLSPDVLLEITKMGFDKGANQLLNIKGPLGSYELSVDPEVLDFVVNYKYIPSENARPINGRLENFIFNQIYWAIKSKRVRTLGIKQDVHLSLIRYNNGVVSVKFSITDTQNDNNYSFTRVVPETLSDKVLKPLGHERVKEIAQMRDVINSNVAGVEHIVDQLIEAAIVSEAESRNSGESTRPATVLAFLGKTSTGKSETAKQFVKARYGEGASLNIIDFNGVRSLRALEAKVLGSFDERNNPIPSDFMKAYDRAQDGKITFIFDEAANSPKELLKGLYEILRESNVTGFTDGKSRSMKNVTIIITGNAGESIYKSIPLGLPQDIYERALHEVFRLFIANEQLQKRILQETFPEAFLARLGKNIFHFGPLTDSGKRKVGQIKLVKGIQNLKPKPSEVGWNILFKSESDLLNLFEIIEREGFDHDYQGASIDKFVREAIIDKIKAKLLMANISNNQNVIIEVDDNPILKNENLVTHAYRKIKLILDDTGESFLEIEIPVGLQRRKILTRETDKILTAYHEVGHEIVSEVYFGDQRRPKYLSIIEGVSVINGELVHYDGIRAGDENERSPYTKEFILRNAAVLAGGYVAQRLVTLGGRHDAGKGNDLHRSTQIIQEAILRYGLSNEWGFRAVPSGMKTADFIQQELSDEEKKQLSKITNKWLSEARWLAREAIMINSESLFIEMSKKLSENGDLRKNEIEELYEKFGVITERDTEIFASKRAQVKEVVDQIQAALEVNEVSFYNRYTEENFKLEDAHNAFDYLMKSSKGRWRSLLSFNSPWNDLNPFQQFVASMYIAGKVSEPSRDAVLSSDLWVPSKLANVDELLEIRRKEETDRVTELKSFNYSDSNEKNESFANLSCRSIL